MIIQTVIGMFIWIKPKLIESDRCMEQIRRKRITLIVNKVKLFNFLSAYFLNYAGKLLGIIFAFGNGKADFVFQMSRNRYEVPF